MDPGFVIVVPVAVVVRGPNLDPVDEVVIYVGGVAYDELELELLVWIDRSQGPDDLVTVEGGCEVAAAVGLVAHVCIERVGDDDLVGGGLTLVAVTDGKDGQATG